MLELGNGVSSIRNRLEEMTCLRTNAWGSETFEDSVLGDTAKRVKPFRASS